MDTRITSCRSDSYYTEVEGGRLSSSLYLLFSPFGPSNFNLLFSVTFSFHVYIVFHTVFLFYIFIKNFFLISQTLHTHYPGLTPVSLAFLTIRPGREGLPVLLTDYKYLAIFKSFLVILRPTFKVLRNVCNNDLAIFMIWSSDFQLLCCVWWRSLCCWCCGKSPSYWKYIIFFLLHYMRQTV